ncbi:MAG: c-type cytochrome [Pyrinomonadaceae bacterium]
MNRTVRRTTGAGLGLLLSTLLLFGFTSVTGSPVQPKSKSRTARVDDLFRTNCARCHGADGRGDTPLGQTYKSPDFTDDEWWRKHSDITSTRSLISIVTHGKGGMPAFGKKLKSSDIKLLVNHVRRFRK